MENTKSILDNSYSNSNLNSKNTVTVTVVQTFKNLTDLIPEDDYRPFYVKKYNELGYKRFMELANKARAGRQPQHLFTWLLKNHEIAR